jgi:hypothetical protein
MSPQPPVVVNPLQIKTIVHWMGYSGCFLLGPGTLILNMLFMIYEPGREARVYCKDMDWYLDTASRSDGCKMSIATDTICESIVHRSINVPTISKTIEYWPYATALVLGTAVINMFTAVIFYSILHEDRYIPFISYISVISMWSVFGTSAYGDSLSLYYAHAVATSILLISTLSYAAIIMYYRRFAVDVFPMVLIIICFWAVMVCVVCSLLYGVEVDDDQSDRGHLLSQVISLNPKLYTLN